VGEVRFETGAEGEGAEGEGGVGEEEEEVGGGWGVVDCVCELVLCVLEEWEERRGRDHCPRL
jgi:hypothetical protein